MQTMSAALGTNLAPILIGDDMFFPASSSPVLAGLDAAAAAGYQSVLLGSGHVSALQGDGLDPRLEVENRGLTTIAVEAALAWAADGGDTAGEGERICAQAVAAGAPLIIAVSMFESMPDTAADELAKLAATAKAHDVGVCVEFLPWSPIPTLAAAWELIEPIENTSLMVDAWHWNRQPGGPNPTLLASIPGHRIGIIQLSDTLVEPMDDMMTETMAFRQLPGDGSVDYAELFAAIAAAGATPVIAVEMFNPAFVAEHGTLETAKRSIAAARDIGA